MDQKKIMLPNQFLDQLQHFCSIIFSPIFTSGAQKNRFLFTESMSVLK